jgi:hypothetical protein
VIECLPSKGKGREREKEREREGGREEGRKKRLEIQIPNEVNTTEFYSVYLRIPYFQAKWDQQKFS